MSINSLSSLGVSGFSEDNLTDILETLSIEARPLERVTQFVKSTFWADDGTPLPIKVPKRKRLGRYIKSCHRQLAETASLAVISARKSLRLKPKVFHLFPGLPAELQLYIIKLAFHADDFDDIVIIRRPSQQLPRSSLKATLLRTGLRLDTKPHPFLGINHQFQIQTKTILPYSFCVTDTELESLSSPKNIPFNMDSRPALIIPQSILETRDIDIPDLAQVKTLVISWHSVHSRDSFHPELIRKLSHLNFKQTKIYLIRQAYVSRRQPNQKYLVPLDLIDLGPGDNENEFCHDLYARLMADWTLRQFDRPIPPKPKFPVAVRLSSRRPIDCPKLWHWPCHLKDLSYQLVKERRDRAVRRDFAASELDEYYKTGLYLRP